MSSEMSDLAAFEATEARLSKLERRVYGQTKQNGETLP